MSETKPLYEVIVSNCGNVYRGDSELQANRVFVECRERSVHGVGRMGGEDVTIMRDGEPVKEYFGHLREDNQALGIEGTEEETNNK